MTTISKRYQRQLILPEIGISGQQKLADAKVLLIGAGGLGCPVLQNLAAAGVGRIGIVDGDLVEETNLHRQFLYSTTDCGRNKATTAAGMVALQNPEIEVIQYASYFTRENAFDIAADYQIVVDCTDNLQTRYLINDVTLVKAIPMVYASLHKFEGQISVLNYKQGPSYRCLFPEKQGLETNCDDAGVLGVLTNLMGTLQATEVLKIILDIGSVLSGTLLLYDGLRFSFETVTFQKNQKEIENGLQNGMSILNNTYKKVRSITPAEFLEITAADDSVIIDLREQYEEPKLNLPNINRITLDQVENYLMTFEKNRKIVLLCQQGNRSWQAIRYLQEQGYTNLIHLGKGIEALKEMDITLLQR